MTSPTTRAIALILAEVDSARAKHGNYMERSDDHRRLRVLAEEFGEVARGIRDIEAADDASLVGYQPGAVCEMALADKKVADERAKLRAELVQVAATALRWIVATDGGE